MSWYLTKLAITAVLIVSISEISRINTFIGALFASIPLVSVLAMLWLYIDTHDVEQISSLTISIFWLVLPSLSLFVILPLLLKAQVPFYASMTIGLAIMVGCYFTMVILLRKFGISL